MGLFQLLLEVMLVLADMLPTQLVLFTLPSVKLKLNQRLRPMLDFFMEGTDMVSDSDMLVLDMPDMVVMDSVIPVLDTDTVLDTTARDPLMLNQRLRPMLDFFMEDTDMVLDLDMLVLDMPDMVVMDSDIPVLDTGTVLDTTARDPLMLSQRLRPMMDFFMEDTDMVLDSDTPVLDMLDTAMLLPMLVLATDTVLDTTARDPLMPNPKLRLMLVFSMEDMDTVLDSDTPVLDMPALAMVMVDTVLDTEVSTMVKKA